jgi:hypothetical protein
VSSAGLRPKGDCSGKAQKQLYSKLQTRPPVREGATKLQTRNCLKEISRRKQNWSQVPDGRLTPGQTGRLTVGRKLTATATVFTSYQLPVSSYRLQYLCGVTMCDYINFYCARLNVVNTVIDCMVNCPRLGSTPRHTDWLTVSCNVTLSLTCLYQLTVTCVQLPILMLMRQ